MRDGAMRDGALCVRVVRGKCVGMITAVSFVRGPQEVHYFPGVCSRSFARRWG